MPEITTADLLNRIQSNEDTIYVVNFWATWCHPCIEELPVFSSDRLQQWSKPTKVLLVSLDFKSQKDKQLLAFIRDKKVSHEVMLLDEGNPNEWIDKIDKNWSGAIPATIIYHQDKTVFHEGELDIDGLVEMINRIN